MIVTDTTYTIYNPQKSSWMLTLYLKAALGSETIFGKWKHFKNDEKYILFHLQSSFVSRDI